MSAAELPSRSGGDTTAPRARAASSLPRRPDAQPLPWWKKPVGSRETTSPRQAASRASFEPVVETSRRGARSLDRQAGSLTACRTALEALGSHRRKLSTDVQHDTGCRREHASRPPIRECLSTGGGVSNAPGWDTTRRSTDKHPGNPRRHPLSRPKRRIASPTEAGG